QTLEDAIRQYHERRELGQEDSLAFHRLLMAFVSICQAVAYAHSRKVIHRDLKPQNIALDDFGQVIVLDWGLAKTLGEEEPVTHLQNIQESQTPDNLDVTLAGQVLGTPLYMAPEQASGRIDEIDELTDGYGLGAILFAILTGCAPHEVSNESLGAGSQLSALLDVIVERPPPPVRQLNPNISAGLEAICLKALAKERYARYPSASALADDVQRWMADEPIAAQLESTSKRMRRWVGKHEVRDLAVNVSHVSAPEGTVTAAEQAWALPLGLQEQPGRFEAAAGEDDHAWRYSFGSVHIAQRHTADTAAVVRQHQLGDGRPHHHGDASGFRKL
ncbi:MAG: hypothetical protein B7Z55_18310, partial [Planctomycetales bacterium 12-60-4]